MNGLCRTVSVGLVMASANRANGRGLRPELLDIMQATGRALGSGQERTVAARIGNNPPFSSKSQIVVLASDQTSHRRLFLVESQQAKSIGSARNSTPCQTRNDTVKIVKMCKVS